MRKTCKIIGYVFFSLFLFYIAFYFTFNFFHPRLTVKRMGFKPYIVLSESMMPELNVGDIIVATPKKISDVQKGELIVFQPEDDFLIAHRVAEKQYAKNAKVVLRTKANNVKVDENRWIPNTEAKLDKWAITNNEYIGKVQFKIPCIGFFFLFVKSKQGILTFLFLIVIVYIYRLILQKTYYAKKYIKDKTDKADFDLEVRRRVDESKKKSKIKENRLKTQKEKSIKEKMKKNIYNNNKRRYE